MQINYLWKGIFLNILSAFLFYFATVMVHQGIKISTDSDAFLYAFYRYYFGSVLFLFLVLFKKIPLKLQIPFSILSRGVFNSIAVILFYFSVELGETNRANVLNMTYPVFVALISGPLLKEYPDKNTWFSLLLSFVGMSLFFIEPLTKLLHQIIFADFLGLSSGILASLAIVALRSSAKKYSSELILFWMFFIGVVITLPFTYRKIFLLDKFDFFYLLASSVMGVLGQWFLTISYKFLDATKGSIFSSFRILIALFYGALVLKESINLYSILGGILVFISNVFLSLRKK